MKRPVRLLLLALPVLVWTACGVSSDPRFDVIDAYVRAHNNFDPSAAAGYFTDDARFIQAGRDTIVGRAKLLRMETMDSAFHDQLHPMDYTAAGDTVTVHLIKERNDWFAGLGIDEIHHVQGTAFVFKGDKIAEVTVKGLTPASQAALDSARTAFIVWAHQHHPQELNAVMPNGQLAQDMAHIGDLRNLLDQYSDARLRGRPTFR